MLLQYNEVFRVKSNEKQQNIGENLVIFHIEQKTKPALQPKYDIDTPYQNLLSSMDSPMRLSYLRKQGKVLEMEIQALSIQNYRVRSNSDGLMANCENSPSATINKD